MNKKAFENGRSFIIETFQVYLPRFTILSFRSGSKRPQNRKKEREGKKQRKKRKERESKKTKEEKKQRNKRKKERNKKERKKERKKKEGEINAPLLLSPNELRTFIKKRRSILVSKLYEVVN